MSNAVLMTHSAEVTLVIVRKPQDHDFSAPSSFIGAYILADSVPFELPNHFCHDFTE